MKTLLLVAALIIALSTSAQKNKESESPGKTENKIETIKIVNGDTVYHEIRLISEDMSRSKQNMNMRVHQERWNEEIGEEMEDILKDVDIYVNMDNHKKKMILHRMKMYDDDFDSFIEEWNKDDDMIIDMKSGKNQIKIIKIDMDDMKGEDVKVIEIHRNRNADDDAYRSYQRERRSSGKSNPLKVFPNPAENEINLEFEVMEGKATEITIMDMSGKKIFNKTYTEAGIVKEKVKLKEGEKGMMVISLLDPNRTVSKSIIIE